MFSLFHHHHLRLRRDSDDAMYYKQVSWDGGDRPVLPRDPASLDQKEKQQTLPTYQEIIRRKGRSRSVKSTGGSICNA
jgi:hypothetical protein